MSETVRAMPGTVPRNGMPPAGGYQYSGRGYDLLNPRQSISGVRRQKRPVTLTVDPDGRCERCGYLVTSAGHRLECEES